jgi:hypothetical protein
MILQQKPLLFTSSISNEEHTNQAQHTKITVKDRNLKICYNTAFPTTIFSKKWTMYSSKIGEFLYASAVTTSCQ